MGADQKNESAGLSTLLQLEAMARESESEKSLQFLIVNETRKLVNYRQAFLFSTRGNKNKPLSIEAVSSLSIIDQNTPFIDWLTRLANFLKKDSKLDSVFQIHGNNCPADFKDEWKEYSLPFALWVPLKIPNGKQIGGIWFSRETAWQDNEITLIKHLSDTYAHAWGALVGKNSFSAISKIKNYKKYFIAACLMLTGLIPVRMSALAPVEIVAKDPVIISAPIDGVIAKINHEPNHYIRENDEIFIFEDTNLRNQFELAEKALSVTVSELKKVKQAAFGDKKSKAEIALLKSEVDLRKAELNYSKELLSQVVVKAKKDGLLIYSDKDDWIGKSVRVGERIMEIANPEKIKLKIDLPVADSILLKENARVDIFLDISPLDSLSAKLIETTYNAEVTPSNVLAYRLYAEFDNPENKLRIGLQGTAKIYGEKVPLFFFLFRRPISTVRQYIGL